MKEVDPRIAEMCRMMGAVAFKIGEKGGEKQVAVIFPVEKLLSLYEVVKESIRGGDSYVA